MFARKFALLLITLAFSPAALLGQEGRVEKYQGSVTLNLTGELAHQYSQLVRPSGLKNPASGIHVSTSAVVAQHFEDGRVRLEHFMPVMTDDQQTGLVTLTATVDARLMQVREAPAGVATFASPASHQRGEKPQFTTKTSHERIVELSELKGVKLRSWTLRSEAGEQSFLFSVPPCLREIPGNTDGRK